MLSVHFVNRVLRFTSAGQLQAWMGPALRGTIGGLFKRQVCVYPPAVQEAERKTCKGCPQMRGCPYGETIESEPANGPRFVGQEDGVRAIVIAPDFPAPARVQPGERLNVMAGFAGGRAQAHALSFWRAAQAVGMDPQLGIGPDQLAFEIIPAERGEQCQSMELPLCALGSESTVRVEIDVVAPLFLRNREEESGNRHLIVEPTFDDLLRASLRVLGGLAAAYDESLPADFAGLKLAGQTAHTVASDFKIFRQWKHSNRANRGTEMVGIVGRGVYDGVVGSLIPWVRWAGLLGVGPFRSAGAGRWNVNSL